MWNKHEYFFSIFFVHQLTAEALIVLGIIFFQAAFDFVMIITEINKSFSDAKNIIILSYVFIIGIACMISIKFFFQIVSE